MRPFIGIAIERRKEKTLAEKDHLPVSNSRVDSPKSDMVGNLNKSNYFCRLHNLFSKLETRVDRNQLRSTWQIMARKKWRFHMPYKTW